MINLNINLFDYWNVFVSCYISLIGSIFGYFPYSSVKRTFIDPSEFFDNKAMCPLRSNWLWMIDFILYLIILLRSLDFVHLALCIILPTDPFNLQTENIRLNCPQFYLFASGIIFVAVFVPFTGQAIFLDMFSGPFIAAVVLFCFGAFAAKFLSSTKRIFKYESSLSVTRDRIDLPIMWFYSPSFTEILILFSCLPEIYCFAMTCSFASKMELIQFNCLWSAGVFVTFKFLAFVSVQILKKEKMKKFAPITRFLLPLVCYYVQTYQSATSIEPCGFYFETTVVERWIHLDRIILCLLISFWTVRRLVKYFYGYLPWPAMDEIDIDLFIDYAKYFSWPNVDVEQEYYPNRNLG